MKPLYLLVMATVLLASCRKQKPTPVTPIPVTKQVSFSVYAAKNYDNESTGSPWKWASGTVKLSIDKLTMAGSVITVWDTTFTERRLTEYPLQPNKFEVATQVTVLEPQEQLLIKQEVVYGVSGIGPQRFGQSYNLSAPEQKLHVNVAL